MKIKRKIYDQVRRHIDQKEITMLIGPRQAGKTTIMKQVEQDLIAEGKKTLFLNLDIERDFAFVESQEKLLHYIATQHILLDKNATIYIFIDEFQKKKGAGVFLKGIYDMGLPYKFIISGSGSVELKENTHESLAGRKQIFTIYPLSFEEFALYKTNDSYQSLTEIHTLEPKKEAILLDEYMTYGGYPKVVLMEQYDEKYLVIREIVESFLHKDALNMIKYEKLDDFLKLIRILGTYNAGLIEYSNLSTATGLAQKTIKNYIQYLEETHILQRITPFTKKKIGEITKMPTMYFIDIGLLQYVLGNFGALQNEKKGLLFQTIMWRIFYEAYMYINGSVHYWRTKSDQEIDFVIENERGLSAYEVKYTAAPKTPRALFSFKKKYPDARLYVASLAERSVVEDDVMILPYCAIVR